MCFHSSRFEARVNEYGDLVDLEHQNRNKYNQELIKIGEHYLTQSTVMNATVSNYQLEAAVSYEHCIAKTFKDTHWQNILILYDTQLKKQFSPVIELNRVVPYSRVYGAEKGLKALELVEKSNHFKDTHLYYAIKADLLFELNQMDLAAKNYRKAISINKNLLEQKHLTKKLKKTGV